MAKIETLQNSFAFNTNGFTESTSGGGTVAIDGQTLLLSCGAGSAGVDPAADYDVTDSEVYLQVVAWPTTPTWHVRPFTIEDIGGGGYRIRVIQGTGMLLDRMVGGSGVVLTTLGVPTNRCWFRFRETSGTFFIEQAPDPGTGLPGVFAILWSEPTNTNAAYDPTQNRPSIVNLFASDANSWRVAGYNTTGRAHPNISPGRLSPNGGVRLRPAAFSPGLGR